MKDETDKDALTLSRRKFIARSGLGTAAVLMDGLPRLAACSPIDKASSQSPAAGERTALAPLHVSLDGKWKLFYFP